MELSNDEGIEASAKKQKISDKNKDYISELPDSILVHTLSFLPIGDAIKTVHLRRFGNLWRNTSVLDLDDCLYHECGTYDYDNEGAYHNETFVGLIRNVLNLHDRGTLEKLRLKVEFDLHYSKDMGLFDDPDFEDYVEREKSTAEQIEKLISYGISRNVKVLDIDLRGCSSYVDQSLTYNVPDVFRSNYLTELRLVACDVRSWRNICLESLKDLLLDEVSLNDVIMENILLGCPSLEDLSLVNCNGLGNLNCQNPNLKKIMLTLAFEPHQLLISCPFVLMLDIAGRIERAYLVDVSSVVNASIFFSKNFRCVQKSYLEVGLLLDKFRLCKTFSPCTWSILVFTIWNFKNVPRPSFKWKNLILELSLTKWHHPGISLLLRSCPSLETLTMYIYPPWGDIFTNPESKWIEDHDFDGESYWDSQEATFPHLKSITIYGFINKPYEIQMVKFLLTSAVNLQKMVISTKESFAPTRQEEIFLGAIERQKDQFTFEQLHELSNKLWTLPRASSEAVIYFS